MNNLNIKDPVCGMNVSETSKFSTTNDKKEYYFCSQNCLDKFEKKFNVDLSQVKWSYYFPWENTPLLTRWFRLKREDVERTRKPLTIRMFSESAKAGKWLYD